MYIIEDPIPVSPETYRIYTQNDGHRHIVGAIYGDSPDAAKLRKFIESHSLIIEALHAASDDSLCRRQSVAVATQIATLLKRLEGKQEEVAQ